MSYQLAQDLVLPNTLALPSRAREALVATSIDQLRAGLTSGRHDSIVVLGSGSNVVLPTSLQGLTILMRIRGIAKGPKSGDLRVFEVGAGESWQGFVKFCVGQGLGGGVENLTLIPGTVGAAPIQNIGAYGVEVAQFILAVQVIDLQQPAAPPAWLDSQDCAFGYRDSLFKQQPGRWLVTKVRFGLRNYEAGSENLQYAGIKQALDKQGCTRITPSAISEAIALLRRSKLPDPRRYANAGSFFKNPICSTEEFARLSDGAKNRLSAIPSWPHAKGRKLAAAALIEQAGFKRLRHKGVGVWFRQPLVLVNYDKADASAIDHFANTVRRAVFERFSIALEQEPVRVT